MAPREQGVPEPFRLPQGGLIERGADAHLHFRRGALLRRRPATRSPRRCSPTASISSAAHSNITARAASSPPGRRSRMRSSSCGAGRGASPTSNATTIELYDGLEAKSQNRWPSLAFDLLSINSLLSPFLSAGFYYKTFMWPARFWKAVYEPMIRRSAGLGRAARQPDPDTLREGARPLRRARHRLGPCRADGGAGCGARRRARDPGRGGFPLRRAAAVGAASFGWRAGARLGRTAVVAELKPPRHMCG